MKPRNFPCRKYRRQLIARRVAVRNWLFEHTPYELRVLRAPRDMRMRVGRGKRDNHGVPNA